MRKILHKLLLSLRGQENSRLARMLQLFLYTFQEPFEEMSDVFKVKLSSSAAAHLNRVLRKIDMEHFLPQLLEMILLKVKHADENIADMR